MSQLPLWTLAVPPLGIILIPAIWLGLLQHREKRRIVEWTRQLAVARLQREAEERRAA